MNHLFLIPHNHKYKLSKNENGLLKFAHADVKLYFFRWLVGLFQWKHNLRNDQNSILRILFIFCETKYTKISMKHITLRVSL